MPSLIEEELFLRMRLWADVHSNDPENIAPKVLRDAGIYGGAQGIWVDKERTASLSPDGMGITVGILHTGRHYPDDLSDDGVIYHYPATNRGGLECPLLANRGRSSPMPELPN